MVLLAALPVSVTVTNQVTEPLALHHHLLLLPGIATVVTIDGRAPGEKTDLWNALKVASENSLITSATTFEALDDPAYSGHLNSGGNPPSGTVVVEDPESPEDPNPLFYTVDDFQADLDTYFPGGAGGNFWVMRDAESDGGAGIRVPSRTDGAYLANDIEDTRSTHNGEAVVDFESSTEGMFSAVTGTARTVLAGYIHDGVTFVGSNGSSWEVFLDGKNEANGGASLVDGVNPTNDFYAFSAPGYGIGHSWRGNAGNQIEGAIPTRGNGLAPVYVGRLGTDLTMSGFHFGGRTVASTAIPQGMGAFAGWSSQVVPPDVLARMLYHLQHVEYRENDPTIGMHPQWPGWVMRPRMWRDETADYRTERDLMCLLNPYSNRGATAFTLNGSWLHSGAFPQDQPEWSIMGGAAYMWLKSGARNPDIDQNLSNWTRTGGDASTVRAQDAALGISRRSWRIHVTEDITLTSPSYAGVAGNHVFSVRARTVSGTASAASEVRLKDSTGPTMRNVNSLIPGTTAFDRSWVFDSSTIDQCELFFDHDGFDYVVEVTMVMHADDTHAPEGYDTAGDSEAVGTQTVSGHTGGFYEVTPPGATGQIVLTAWTDPAFDEVTQGGPAAGPSLIATGYLIWVDEVNQEVVFEFNGGAEEVRLDFSTVASVTMTGWWGVSVKWNGTTAYCALFNQDGLIDSGSVATNDVWGAGTFRSVILGSDGLAVNHLNGLIAIPYLDTDWIDGATGTDWGDTAAMLTGHFAEAELERNYRESMLYPELPGSTLADYTAQGFGENLMPQDPDDWQEIFCAHSDGGGNDEVLITPTTDATTAFQVVVPLGESIGSSHEVIVRMAIFDNNLQSAFGAVSLLDAALDPVESILFDPVTLSPAATGAGSGVSNMSMRRWRGATSAGSDGPGHAIYILELRFTPNDAGIENIAVNPAGNGAGNTVDRTIRYSMNHMHLAIRDL